MNKPSKLFSKLFSDKRIKYLVVGGSAFFLEYGIFIALNGLLGLLISANVISFIIGLTYSFFLHRQWTFTGIHKHNSSRQVISYLALALTNLILTSILISFFVESLGILPFLAKIICMLLVVAWNFLILNKIIFKVIVAR